MRVRRCRVCRGWHDLAEPWPEECVDHYGQVETERSTLPMPYIQGDIQPYRSPLGTGEISSRSQRREDMKRGNVREVDPSERPDFGRPVRPRGHHKMNPAQLKAATEMMEKRR